LIGTDIVFPPDAQILIGRSKLFILAHNLILNGNVQLRGFDRGPRTKGEVGSGAPGWNAGNVSIFVLGSIQGTGKVTVDLRGEDGDTGQVGEAGQPETTRPSEGVAPA